MDHQYVEEHNIADRYLMKKLSAMERDEFEAHYFECEACTRRLEIAEKLRRGLQHLDAEEIARLRTSGNGDREARWAWLGRRRPVLITLAALLLLAALPITFLILDVSRARQEREQAQADAAQWQRRYETEEQAARAWEEKFRDAEQLLAPIRRQSQPSPVAEDPDRRPMGQPQINIPIFDLVAVRGPVSEATKLGNEITLKPSMKWFMLTLDLETEPKQETYRATILTSDNRLVWSASGLRPSRDNQLTIGVPGDFFATGQFLLRLDELTGSGEAATVAAYPFQVVRTDKQ